MKALAILFLLAACSSPTAPAEPLPPCEIIGVGTVNYYGKLDTVAIAYRKTILCTIPGAKP